MKKVLMTVIPAAVIAAILAVALVSGAEKESREVMEAADELISSAGHCTTRTVMDISEEEYGSPWKAGAEAADEAAKAADEPEYTFEQFMYDGVIHWHGWRYTYYSELVLPGGGLDIPGRHSDGQFVRDGDGNICVAAHEKQITKGTHVETPFGPAVVYDCGCPWGTIDIYVTY